MTIPRKPESQGPTGDHRIDHLPLKGRDRVAAVNRLLRVLADDFEATGKLLQLDGMTDEDVMAVLDCQRYWFHALIDQAHAQASTYVRWSS